MRLRSRTGLAVALAGCVGSVLGAPSSGRAQVRASIDLGGASVRYADSVRMTATTVAPTVRVDGGPFSAVAFGNVSVLGGDTWSSQGGVTASLLSRPLGIARVEVVGAGLGTMLQDGNRTGQLLGRLRLHASGATGGLWLGGGAGRAWDGATWRRSIEGDIAGWIQHNSLTMVATMRPAATGDSVRYTDFGAMARRDAKRLDLSASAGIRTGITAPAGSPNAWASVSAAIWVSPQLALVADGGSYPTDVEQGFPGGSYLSLGLRIAPRRRLWTSRSMPTTGATAARLAASVTADARVEVVPLGNGSYAVRVHAAEARRVEVMGDFTEWAAEDLVAGGKGWWQLVTRVTPGVRQLTVRINGGRWTVPAGATVDQDEFGQPVGVVLVR